MTARQIETCGAMRIAGIAVLLTLASSTTAFAQRPINLGPIFLGYDLDMPDNPSIEQQIEGGKKQIVYMRQEDATLDSDHAVYEYFNSITARLLEHSDARAPFPIEVHVSMHPIVNAEALPGGVVVVFRQIFDLADTEGELVAILAHELAHQLHNDFLIFWHAYKIDAPVFGSGGVLDISQSAESLADATGARLMYAAGWNPAQMVGQFRHLDRRGAIARGGRDPTYTTHPKTRDRIKAIEELIATFPPKDGLIQDTPKFQELKRRSS